MVMMPDQRSVTDQLKDLVVLANRRGLYDAADWIQSRLQKHNEYKHTYDHRVKAKSTSKQLSQE